MFDLDPKIMGLAKILLCVILGAATGQGIAELAGLTGLTGAIIGYVCGGVIGAGAGVIWSFKSRKAEEEE